MSSDPRKDLHVLRRITDYFSKEHTLEYALQEVTDAALELLPGDHASVRVLDSSGRGLLATARSGAGTDQRSLALHTGEGIAGWVARPGVAAVVREARPDRRCLEAIGQGFRIRSMVAEPLLSVGAVIGVLSVSSPLPDAFADADEQLAHLLANCTAPLIAKSRLERLSLVDAQTLAFNANYLRPRLAEEIERARQTAEPLSVLVIDLDHLERINRPYGRDIGDVVLGVFTSRVRALSRRYDAFVRWGGDEFVLLMPGTSPSQASTTAERLRAMMAEEPMEPRPGGLLTQEVSIGVATWDQRETVEELLERAAAGLAEAKRLGGNCVVRGGAPGPEPRRS